MNETLTNLFAAIGLSVTFSAIGGCLSWNVAGVWIKLRKRRRAKARQAPETTTLTIQGPDCSDTATQVDHIKP
jgi:hypothetical protein